MNSPRDIPKFIIDNNAGKLVKWLRMIGYDTIFFEEPDDTQMVRIALKENRIIITKDSQFMKRRIITSGKIKAILIKDDYIEKQIQQAVKELNLDSHSFLFSRCLECNALILPIEKEKIQNLVPPYVYKTQGKYAECAGCHRIYWQGTHWQTMIAKLENLKNS